MATPNSFLSSITLDNGIVVGGAFTRIMSDDIPGLTLKIGNPVAGGKPYAVLTTDPVGNLIQYSPGLIYDRDGHWDGNGGAAPLGTASTLYIGGETTGSVSHLAFHKILPTPSWASFGISGVDQFTVFPANLGFAMGYCRILLATASRACLAIDQQGVAATADMIICQIAGAGTTRFRLNHDGFPIFNQQAAYTEPPDGDLAVHEFSFWFDPTNGAASFNIKGKDSTGVVVRATVPLT